MIGRFVKAFYFNESHITLSSITCHCALRNVHNASFVTSQLPVLKALFMVDPKRALNATMPMLKKGHWEGKTLIHTYIHTYNLI